MFRNVSKLLLVALVLGGGACSDSPVPTGDDRNASQDTQCPVAADIGVPQLSDEQIVQVVMTINMGEIEQGQLALAQNPPLRQDVIDFANRMVQEHTTANQQLQTALQLAGITPQDSPLNQQLLAQESQTLAILRASGTGEDFERAYMDVQVGSHAKALFLMDSIIQPQLQRRELRDLSSAARAVVQDHLNRAVPIQASVPARP